MNMEKQLNSNFVPDSVPVYRTRLRMCPMCDCVGDKLKTLRVKKNCELLECLFCHTIFIYQRKPKHHYIQFAHGKLYSHAYSREQLKRR